MQINKFNIPAVALIALISCVPLPSAKADSVTTTTTIDSPATPTQSGIVYLRTASPSVLVTTIEGPPERLRQAD